MSAKAVGWALRQKGTTPAQKSVLVVIAHHFNDAEHSAWPSHGLVAEESSLGRSTVVRAVAELRDKLGLIETEESVDRNNRQTSNRYYLPDFDPRSRRGDADTNQ